MFLNELSKNEQEIFLNLAYTLMYADNKVRGEEKKHFQLYQTEVQTDITNAKSVDFITEITKLQALDFRKKQIIFVELIGLALVDTEYAAPERILLNEAGQILSISIEKRKTLTMLVNKLLSIYRELNEVMKN